MAFTFLSLAFSLAVLPLASSHFNLQLPTSYGFEDKTEGEAPCGGFTIDFGKKEKVVDFHVDGDAISTRLGHAESHWLYRATIDHLDVGNWSQLYPIIHQEGIGQFCEPSITAPSHWAGKQGIVSVVADGPDGLLYQCAAVNFVSGKADEHLDCTNGTVEGTIDVDKDLSALVGVSVPTSTPTPSSPSPSSTPSDNSAPAVVAASFGVSSIVTVALMAALGVAML